MHIKQHSEIAEELIETRAVASDLKDSIEIAMMDGVHENKKELYELLDVIEKSYHKIETHWNIIREKLFLKSL